MPGPFDISNPFDPFSPHGKPPSGVRLPYVLDPAELPDGPLPSIWTAAAYAIASGKIVGTPTLGAELLANGNFATDSVWSKGAGWAIPGGAGAVGTATSGLLIQGSIGTAGGWYKYQHDIVSRTAGTVRMLFGGSGPGTPARSTPGTFHDAEIWVGDAGCYFQGSGFSGEIDNASCKLITLATMFGEVDWGRNLVSASAEWTQNPGTTAGVYVCRSADGNSFVVGHHDGVSTIKLRKRVGSTWTTLVSASVAYSADSLIEVRQPDTTVFQLWYGGVQIGSDQTVTDAGIINNTRVGLFSSSPLNQCTYVRHFVDTSLGAYGAGDFTYSATLE